MLLLILFLIQTIKRHCYHATLRIVFAVAGFEGDVDFDSYLSCSNINIVTAADYLIPRKLEFSVICGPFVYYCAEFIILCGLLTQVVHTD